MTGPEGGFEAGDKIQQLGGDGGLALDAVSGAQFLDMFRNIFFRVLQRSQATGLFTGQRLGLDPEKMGKKILTDQPGK